MLYIFNNFIFSLYYTEKSCVLSYNWYICLVPWFKIDCFIDIPLYFRTTMRKNWIFNGQSITALPKPHPMKYQPLLLIFLCVFLLFLQKVLMGVRDQARPTRWTGRPWTVCWTSWVLCLMEQMGEHIILSAFGQKMSSQKYAQRSVPSKTILGPERPEII